MTKQLMLKQRTVRKHTKVDRDEVLDNLWRDYYKKEASLKKDKETLVLLTSKAISEGKTLYNVTWVSPSFIPDKAKMLEYYQENDWLIPQITETDYKSMTQYLKDEEVAPEEWKKLKKGFPQKPRKKERTK